MRGVVDRNVVMRRRIVLKLDGQ